jgi:amino-acid N-acetyltransferase
MEMEIKTKVIKDAETFNEFRALLKTSGLPHADLDFQNHILIGYYDEEKLIGTGALEIYKPYALLRSLAVSDTMRGQSLGSKITDDIIREAKKNNIKGIYLLTETARLFFRRKGFKDIQRNDAPKEVTASTEFSSVCSDSAVCMELVLRTV